ncbi:MAG: TonB-dependent receptor [Pedobacter sp.]|nr:MAG: TonB-dependent receptor [Pedobacter sp.]
MSRFKSKVNHLLLFLIFSIQVVNAQTQTGVVTGKIVDAVTNEALPGASVNIEGKQGNAVTDINGIYTLRNVPIGSIKLQIAYIGYETSIKKLNVEINKTSVSNISLKASKNLLSEVRILGTLEGQQRALNQQRSADNIKNIISSDLIGRFPDLNVAEALQRVPGVNIQRDKGEGSTVALRGTPQNFTTVQINGEQLPSVQQSGARNESLDLIPADQLAAIEITKAATPDMDGDAIGGVVNLKTPTAKNTKLNLRAETGLGYNDISGGLNGIGKFRIDKRFFANDKVAAGKLGVMLSGSYFSNNNAEDRLDATWESIERVIGSGERKLMPANFALRKTDNRRERIGLTGTLDYRFDEKSHLIFNYMYNRRNDADDQNRLRYDFDRGSSTWATLNTVNNARIRRDINVWDEDKENHSFNLQGFHTLNKWQIDWGGYYTRSKRDFTSTRGDFSFDGINLRADSENGPYDRFPTYSAVNPAQDVNNPLLLNDFRRYEEDAETTEATNIVAKTDLTKYFNLAGKHQGYLKFGGKFRTQTNKKARNNRVLNFNDPNNVLNNSEAFVRIIKNKQPANFLYRNYNYGPRVDRTKFLDYIDDNRFLLSEADNAWDSRRLSLNDTYNASEDVYSAYAMTRIQFGKLMVLGGLRLEHNNVNYDAFDVVRRGTDVIGTPIKGGTDYTFVLPNLHLKYSLSKLSNLRFSALINYARPNFVDIVPFTNYDADALTLFIGNPELQPARALNLDAMYEYYFDNVGIFSVGAFYKNIDKFQFQRITPRLLEDYPGFPNTQGFAFRQSQNGENATVAGLEVNIYRNLNFLPGFLKWFGVNLNYTYAYSDAFTQDRTNISLPGQAKHTINGAINYDYKGFSIRGSANYNGAFTNSLASNAQDDIVQDNRLQIDVNTSYIYKKHWRIFAEFININNAPSIRYQGERNRTSRIAYFGSGARAGLGYTF